MTNQRTSFPAASAAANDWRSDLGNPSEYWRGAAHRTREDLPSFADQITKEEEHFSNLSLLLRVRSPADAQITAIIDL